MGLMSCAPAYVALVAEAQIDAGVRHGIPAAQGAELVVQTLAGTAELLRRRGNDTLGGAARGHLARRRQPRADSTRSSVAAFAPPSATRSMRSVGTAGPMIACEILASARTQIADYLSR